MENKQKPDLPSGSRSEEGNQRSVNNPSFLFPRGEESSSTDRNPNPNSNQHQANRPILNRNERVLYNRRGNLDWRYEFNLDNNAPDNSSSSSSSSEHEYIQGNVRPEDEPNRRENLGRPVINVTAYVGYGGFVGFPHIHASYSFAGLLGAPGMGHGLLRLNDNAHDFDRPRVNDGGRGSNLGDYAGNNAGAGRWMDDGFGDMYGAGFNGHNSRDEDRRIFYYTTTTAYAHLRRNGEGLSEMLSLRDAHIFTMMHAVNYVSLIYQICNNGDLSLAMINHLDCLKALMMRNLGLALTKQIACVNAVMKLLNDPYSRHENWTYPVIRTVTYDLRIINERAISAGCQGRLVLHYDWMVNNRACFYHPFDCQCQQPKVYRTRNFYRRY